MMSPGAHPRASRRPHDIRATGISGSRVHRQVECLPASLCSACQLGGSAVFVIGGLVTAAVFTGGR